MSDYAPLVDDVVLVGRTGRIGTVLRFGPNINGDATANVRANGDGAAEVRASRWRPITIEKISDLTPAPIVVGDTVRKKTGNTVARYLVTVDSAENAVRQSSDAREWVGVATTGWSGIILRAELVKVALSPTDDDGCFPRWPDGELVRPGDVVHALSPRSEGIVVESRAVIDGRPRVHVKFGAAFSVWMSDCADLRRGSLPPEEDVAVSFSVPASLLAQVVALYKACVIPGEVPKLPHLQLIGRALDSLSADEAEKVGWSTPASAAGEVQ